MLAVTLAAAFVLARAPARQIGDEANWLGTARYFLVLFVRHDVSAEAWPDSYWTRTQPMVPRYVMGGWLWARGYDFEWLDPNFDHTAMASCSGKLGCGFFALIQSIAAAPPDSGRCTSTMPGIFNSSVK